VASLFHPISVSAVTSKLMQSRTLEFYRKPSPAIIVMSNTNLQQSQVPSLAIPRIDEFAGWLYTARFQTEGGGSQRCVDPDLTRQIQPLLRELGIDSLVGSSRRNPRTATNNGTSLVEKIGGILFGACLVSQEHGSKIHRVRHTSTLYACTKIPLQRSPVSL
jgi:hypothetical protein